MLGKETPDLDILSTRSYASIVRRCPFWHLLGPALVVACVFECCQNISGYPLPCPKALIHYILELIQAFLPATVTLYPYFHTSENDLFAPFEVYAELYDIAVVDRIRTTLHTGTTQSHVVEKCARTALDVLYKPLPVLTP